MEKITIYHNPRCSKSREALQLLRAHHKEPVVIEYLKNPLSEKEITQLLVLLALSPRDLLRKNEELYKTLELDNPKLNDKALIAILAKHPILIERPIVVINNKAIVARPPEKVLELI